MEASNSRVLALNILKEPGVLASGIRVPELKSCPKCREEILSDPPQSITILSCNHVFHRACIEKDLLSPTSSTNSDILVIATSTQDTMEGNETTSDEPNIAEFIRNDDEPVSEAHDIVEFLDKGKTRNGNDNEPVSEAHDSELMSKTPILPVPTWIKEKLNANNNADYEFMRALGLIEEPLEEEQVQTTNQTSADKGNVRAPIEATSSNEEQE